MTDTANTSAQSDNFWMQYNERLKNLKAGADEAANGLRKVFIYLQSLNPDLTKVLIEYDGCGDSGQVENARFLWAADHQEQPIVGADQPLPDEIACGKTKTPGHWVPGQGYVTTGEPVNASATELIDELAWDLAYGQNPGFEINEGGYGTISIEVSPDDPDRILVSLSHSERYIETTDYEYEL